MSQDNMPEETGVQSEAPTKRRPTSGEEDVQETRKPIKRPGDAKPNMLPWLIGAGCGVVALFGCLICSGGGIWWYTSSQKAAGERAKESEARRQKEQKEQDRQDSINNLKNLGLALHGFHDANKSLPNHAILNNNGQPLLSWRVAVLPYIDELPLYNQINKNEAWDSQNNRQFWNKIPRPYQLPGKTKDDKTYYQVFQGQESAFPRSFRNPPFAGLEQRMTSGATLVGCTDGTSNTIFIVEAAEGVNWMKPDDIPFQMNPQGFPPDRLGNHWGNDTFHAAMGDGTVRTFRRNMKQSTLQALITRNGGEVVDVVDAEVNP